MSIDPHTQKPIHHGQIWTQSRCLDLEKNAVDSICQRLVALGYDNLDGRSMVWHRDKSTTVLCLVDDVRHCVSDFQTEMPYLYDRNTTVITDNLILCPTMYRVTRLPDSFFGIYAHAPSEADTVDRKFSFLINRIDQKRFLVLLELAKRTNLADGYVNFNCEQGRVFCAKDINLIQLQQNFVKCWHNLDTTQQRVYGSVFDQLKDQMPMKNYDFDHDRALMRSACNIVIEAYSSDTSVAFSEKIFRALSLPRPWMLYGGRYSVAWLESLGFDCLRDIMRHEYDALKESENKIHEFVRLCLQRIQELKDLDPAWLLKRCEEAALHNQHLLWQLRHSWHSDLEIWTQTYLS